MAVINYRWKGTSLVGSKLGSMIRGVCIAAIVVCLGVLGFVGYGYLKSSIAYDELRQYKIENTNGQNLENSSDDLAAKGVDWDALLSKNKDTVAWITIPGTKVDYPVVQTGDNDLYLHQGFDGSRSVCGAIFLDCIDSTDFSGHNCLLYGHHMRDGSMFASLSSFTKQSKIDECDKIYLLTPEKNMLLNPIALVDVSSYDEQIQKRPKTAKDEEKYVAAVLERAICKAKNVDPSKVTQTVGLVTCDELGDDGRYVLVCSVEQTVLAK